MFHVKWAAVIFVAVTILPPIAESAGRIEVPAAALAKDGDTFHIPGRGLVRLFGIDTPECDWIRRGAAHYCPRAEAYILAALLLGGGVGCEILDRDRHGRDVARCWRGGLDIGRVMVEAGMARAARWDGRRLVLGEGDYAFAEERAFRDGEGYWRCGAETPPKFMKMKADRCR